MKEQIHSLLNSIKSAGNENGKKRFVCVECGWKVNQLYKKYPSSVRLEICEKCNQIADKYIEFETIIILIDLILLSRAAYRHVIFNTESKNLWKLAVIITLLESYCRWVEQFKSDDYHYKPFESEKAFYCAGLQVIFDNTLLFIFIFLLSSPMKFGSSPHSAQLKGHKLQFAANLLRALILSSIGKFFFLPIVIWRENSTETQIAIHLSIVITYFVLSLVYAHSVVNYGSRRSSFFIVILAFVSKSFISSELDLFVKGQLF